MPASRALPPRTGSATEWLAEELGRLRDGSDDRISTLQARTADTASGLAAATAPVRGMVSKTATQALPSGDGGVWVRLTYAAPGTQEGYADGVTWDATNHEWDITVGGAYWVHVSMSAGATANGHKLRLGRIRGGVTTHRGGDERREAFGSHPTYIETGRQMQLNAADVVFAETVSAASGQAYTVEAGVKFQFSVHRLSP